MDIAAMNTKIVIQKNETVVDEIGNRSSLWKDYFSCFASVSDSTGKSSSESFSAGTVNEHADISFTVRFCKQTFQVTTTQYRILWNDDIYDIQKIDHLNLKKKALKFKCEKERTRP